MNDKIENVIIKNEINNKNNNDITLLAKKK
jgi:hypothetical protein